ncbi:MAG: DUF3276 family protein [Caldisericaceae bacterium]
MEEEIKELLLEKVTAGKRTYFISVRKASKGSSYLVVAESIKNNDGTLTRNSVMIYDDHLEDVNKAIQKAIKFMEKRTESHFDREKVIAKSPNEFKNWTTEEEKLLKEEYIKGKSIEQLSKEFSRSINAITHRLEKLGLIDKPKGETI